MATKKPTEIKVRRGRFGDLKGSQAQWHLLSPKRNVDVRVKLVDKYAWGGVKFLVVQVQ